MRRGQIYSCTWSCAKATWSSQRLFLFIFCAHLPGFWHLSILYRLLYSYLLLACLNRGCANLVPTFVFSFTCFCIFCICYFVSSQNLVPVQTVVCRLASRAPNVACSPLPCLEINDHDATQCILINCHDNPTIMPRCVKYHRHLGKGTCMVANS